MSLRARIVAALLAAALPASTRGIVAQQPVPAALVPAGPSDSTHRTVTALGIDRDARSLGAAQQTVSGDSITVAGETNLVSALAGRVTGADVSGSGASGTSVSLLLRGARSASGDDQPLFVVDGVPVANATLFGNQNQLDFGSSLADIDPNDVASITVLDGPNASALYGSRAQNGAVLITTKTAAGMRGFSLTARQDYTFESPARLPAFQTRYALGDNGVYFAGGIGAWGPAVFGTDQAQWWSHGQSALLVAQPNDERNFLVQGHTATTTAAVSAASSRADVRLGITNVGQDGLQPNSGLDLLNTSLSAGIEPVQRLRIRLSGQYARRVANQEPGEGPYADDALFAFMLTGSGIDVAHLRTDALTNHQDAFLHSFGVDNPYWVAYESSNRDTRDHAIGVVSADYAFTRWLSASIRTGVDLWHDHNFEHDSMIVGEALPVENGIATGTTYREQNSDFLVSATAPLGPRAGMSIDAGAATRGGSTHSVTTVSDDFGGFGRIAVASTRVQTNSLYGRTAFSFDSTWFVDATGRRDWTRLGGEFYPSVSAAWDFVRQGPNATSAGVVSTGKLRASWAQVGGEENLFLESISLDRTMSWEGGVDLGLLRNRASLDATYYDERTRSRYFNLNSTGFGSVNPMAVSNHGVELALGARALERDKDLQWDVGLHFATNRSRTDGATPGRGLVGLGGHAAVVMGQPYGTIEAEVPVRDSLGRVIMSGGLPILQNAPLGSELPSWVGGLENDVRYRQFSLMLLVDSRHGGRVYSETNVYGTFWGTLASTAALRGGGSFILPGVNPDGTPNTTPVDPQFYFEQMAQTATFSVYDASAFELREVRLGYTVQPDLAARLHVTTLEVAVIGRNLWIHAAAPNFDPQSVLDTGPAQGEETFGVPSTRSLGLTLKVVP
jgi:TonB-dependent SusC/RagA subfamily outer membrane receptor